LSATACSHVQIPHCGGFERRASFSNKLYDLNPSSNGIAFCSSGGGAYATIYTVSILNGLYYGGVLDDKHIKYIYRHLQVLNGQVH